MLPTTLVVNQVRPMFALGFLIYCSFHAVYPKNRSLTKRVSFAALGVIFSFLILNRRVPKLLSNVAMFTIGATGALLALTLVQSVIGTMRRRSSYIALSFEDRIERRKRLYKQLKDRLSTDRKPLEIPGIVSNGFIATATLQGEAVKIHCAASGDSSISRKEYAVFLSENGSVRVSCDNLAASGQENEISFNLMDEGDVTSANFEFGTNIIRKEFAGDGEAFEYKYKQSADVDEEYKSDFHSLPKNDVLKALGPNTIAVVESALNSTQTT